MASGHVLDRFREISPDNLIVNLIKYVKHAHTHTHTDGFCFWNAWLKQLEDPQRWGEIRLYWINLARDSNNKAELHSEGQHRFIQNCHPWKCNNRPWIQTTLHHSLVFKGMRNNTVPFECGACYQAPLSRQAGNNISSRLQ